MTVCTRICLNQLKRSYKQREVYIGEWLPEPYFDEPIKGISSQLEIDDTLTMALLQVLEKLSPTERAAFLLHDIFDMKFSEIAEIIGKTTVNCRQLAARARKNIRSRKSRFMSTYSEHQKLLEGFVHAAQTCDISALVDSFSTNVELYSDGGGKVQALPNMLCGDQKVAEFFFGVFSN